MLHHFLEMMLHNHLCLKRETHHQPNPKRSLEEQWYQNGNHYILLMPGSRRRSSRGKEAFVPISAQHGGQAPVKEVPLVSPHSQASSFPCPNPPTLGQFPHALEDFLPPQKTHTNVSHTSQWHPPNAQPSINWYWRDASTPSSFSAINMFYSIFTPRAQHQQ